MMRKNQPSARLIQFHVLVHQTVDHAADSIRAELGRLHLGTDRVPIIPQNNRRVVRVGLHCWFKTRRLA